jgi:hypothetical protein
MSRYRATYLSPTAIAVDTGFGGIACVATGGFNLRRISGGVVTVGSASAPPDQNCLLGIAPIIAQGTGGIATTPTTTLLNQNAVPALMLPFLTYTTLQPTFGASATDAFQVPVSSRGGFDLYWEGVEEWQFLKGVANGFTLLNRQNALTSPLAWKIDVEWEE